MKINLNGLPSFGVPIPLTAIAPTSIDAVSKPCRLALLLVDEVDLNFKKTKFIALI